MKQSPEGEMLKMWIEKIKGQLVAQQCQAEPTLLFRYFNTSMRSYTYTPTSAQLQAAQTSHSHLMLTLQSI